MKNLQKLRLERNLGQEELAEILNVSRQTITNWENETARPSYEKLIEIADFFNVPIDYLIGRDAYITVNNVQIDPNTKLSIEELLQYMRIKKIK